MDKRLLSVRGSAMNGNSHRLFGDFTERDTHQTYFGEATLSGSSGRHNWTVGSAFQTDSTGIAMCRL
jgi:hypothetical protein